MSGWIKWEKDVETDPRFLRVHREMMKRIGNAPALPVTLACNAPAFMVTLLTGALLRLWSYADTHIRLDDTLDMSCEDIDQYVGVEGFASLLPADWLRATEDGHVELPGYQEHNSVEAKKQAQTTKRVAKHRAKKRNAGVTQEERASVTGALPDQTKTRPRPDQDHSSLSLAERARDAANVSRESTDPDPPGFDGWAFIDQRMRPVYPRGTFRHNHWILAARTVEQLVEQGADPDDIAENAAAYCAQQEAMGNTGTQFVMAPSKFLADGNWRGPFDLPAARATRPTSTAERMTFIPEA